MTAKEKAEQLISRYNNDTQSALIAVNHTILSLESNDIFYDDDYLSFWQEVYEHIESFKNE